MIEIAYQAKKKFVELVDANGTVYIVNFKEKKDYAKMDPTNSVRIMRKEMVAGIFYVRMKVNIYMYKHVCVF